MRRGGARNLQPSFGVADSEMGIVAEPIKKRLIVLPGDAGKNNSSSGRNVVNDFHLIYRCLRRHKRFLKPNSIWLFMLRRRRDVAGRAARSRRRGHILPSTNKWDEVDRGNVGRDLD